MQNPKTKNAAVCAASAAATTSSRGRGRCGPIRSTRRARCTRFSGAFRCSGRSRRASSSTSTPSRCWSPWCCRRKRPTPASTRRRGALFAVADTPQKMLALGEEKVGDYIRTIGLWRNKAKNVIALSRGADPRPWRRGARRPRRSWSKLPGVGRKTANVVLNMAFGQPTMAVDTHIFRLGNRLGLAPGKTPEQVEEQLLQDHPAGISAPRASLADPARPLCLQGAQAGMRALHHRRHLQGGGQDQRDSGAAGRVGAARAWRRTSISSRCRAP